MNSRRKKKLRMKKEIGIENGIGIEKDNEKSSQLTPNEKSCFFEPGYFPFRGRKLHHFSSSIFLIRAKFFNSSLMFSMRAEGEQNRFKRELIKINFCEN
jgi:hypothetical protein